MKRLLLISPLSPGSLMGGTFFFRMPNLGLSEQQIVQLVAYLATLK